VLLFGESAGANAAQALSLMPAASGLFHHFVSESGTFPLATGFKNRSAADVEGRLLAQSLNCTQSAAADIVACLKKLPATAVQEGAGMTQLGDVVGAEMVATYPMRALETGSTINPSLRTMTAGWNTPDNFNVCGPAGSKGRLAGPKEAMV